MKDLISRSYQAIRKRGLITDTTTHDEFQDKIHEEYIEFHDACIWGSEESKIEELVDFITVGVMYLHHSGYDFIKEFEKVVIKNETRKD